MPDKIKNITRRLLSYKIALMLVVVGWVTYKLLIGVFASTSWPGFVMIWLGCVVFIVTSLIRLKSTPPAHLHSRKLFTICFAVLLLTLIVSALKLAMDGDVGFWLLYTYPVIGLAFLGLAIGAIMQWLERRKKRS